MERPPRDPARAAPRPATLIRRIVLVSLLLCWRRLRSSSGAGGGRVRRGGAHRGGQRASCWGSCSTCSTAARWATSIFVGVFSNPWVWAGVTGMLALQALFTYAPVMNRLFHTAPLDAATWGGLALFGLGLSAVVSLEKRGRAARRRRTAPRA